jgi:L-fucose isomerase-like protein
VAQEEGVNIKVILSATSAAWGYLFEKEERIKEIERFKYELEKLKDRLPEDLDLEIHAFTEADEEINFVKTLNSSDAVLYVALSFATPGLNILLEKKVPMIFYQQMYAGHTWSINPLRRSKNVILFMGNNIKDLVRKIRVLYTFKKISQGTRYILVAPEFRKDIMERKEILEKKFNFKALLVKPEELIEYYNNIPEKDAEKVAGEFTGKAIGVVEPSKEEIVKSCRLYLAMKKLMEDKKANCITIDCLTLFGMGKLPAYPCIGFSLINGEESTVAACEGDVYSLFTMYALKCLTGLPSFISDPVIDVSQGTVIHAHCVAPIKMDGEREYPYFIRSHAEDNKGASLEVKFDKIGAPMTVVEYIDGNKIVISTGEVIRSPEINRGCRTKIELKVSNAEAMLKNWHGGEWVSPFSLHRVLVYGNWVSEIEDLAKLLNIEIEKE